MLVMTLRTLILYVVVLIVVRIMGKRELGQLQPFEFVVAILIADLVSVPMSNTGVPIFYGIIPVLTLLMAHLIISHLSLKNLKLRNLFSGKPTIVIANGIIDELALRDLRYNLDDLLEQLREKSIFSVENVEYAILETSGRLSILPKDSKRPILVDDLDLQQKEVCLPHNVIMDGEIDNEELKETDLSIEDLNAKLNDMGYKSVREIFICTVGINQQLYVQPKRKKGK